MAKKLMAIMALAAMALGARAASEVVDGVTWYYGTSTSGGKAYSYIVSGDIKYAGDLVIPPSLGGYPVKSIGNGAFRGCSGLTSVEIPSSVTSIERYAFENCPRLTSVEIPSSVTSVDLLAFLGCGGLTLINVDPGNSKYTSCNGMLCSKDGKTLICGAKGDVTIPSSVTSIGGSAFEGRIGLTSVVIPSSVESIGSSAFYDCIGLTSVVIPASVTRIGGDAFSYFRQSVFRTVEFLGAPPSGVASSGLMSYGAVLYPREYGAEWQKVVGVDKFYGYGQTGKPVVEIVSAGIRAADPTVMDVVFKVASAKPTVKVRALAFEDGVRSFAKVVRPTEFIEGTATNIGDAVAANVEHTLSWRVSSDWKVDLAKVKFEVLASEGELLPFELTTIPATTDHAAMEISWNALAEKQFFDALLWLYADGDAGLSLENGVLKSGSSQLANGDKLYHARKTVSGKSVDIFPAPEYVFAKMGFSLLSGDELEYAKRRTRLALAPDGIRQYAYRMTK